MKLLKASEGRSNEMVKSINFLNLPQMPVKVFIDWSIRKGYVVLMNADNPKIINDLDFPPSTEVYIESGCPKFLLYNLINKDCKIFISQSNETAHLREELKIEKTDENDVKVLQLLYQKNPTLFKELLTPDKDEIKLKFIVGKFEALTKIIIGLKSRARMAEKEFGEFDFLKVHLRSLEKEKYNLIISTKSLLTKEMKVISIRGINITLLARLLAQAHPIDFPTLSSYLAYCGYKGYMKKRNEKGKGKRPNYIAHGALAYMAICMLKCKNPTYRALYDKCKLRYQTEHPDWTKLHIHNKSLNIVATYIAKEFWYKLHDMKEEI